MITQQEIDTLRSQQQERFEQLTKAGFKPARIAAIIQEQDAEKATRERENPPQAQALARVKAAEDIVLKHLDRARLSKGELDKLITEVRVQFPELQIEVLTLEPGNGEEVTALNELIEQLKNDNALQAERIAQLEDAGKRLADLEQKLAEEQAARAKAEGDLEAAFGGSNELQAKITAALAAKSLKAAHEALT